MPSRQIRRMPNRRKLLCSFGLFLLAFWQILYFKSSLFIFLAKKQWWRREKTEKEQGSATDHSALLHHNAHALVNQIVCYIYHTYIIKHVKESWSTRMERVRLFTFLLRCGHALHFGWPGLFNDASLMQQSIPQLDHTADVTYPSSPWSSVKFKFFWFFSLNRTK
jgi:hypothetical protein